MSIKSIVEKYNKQADFMTEHKIPASVVEAAEKLAQLFKDNKIDGYDIIPASTGELYFDWDTETLSFGVAIASETKATFEYLHKKVNEDSYVEAYDLSDKDDVTELITVISDILYGV